jgi:hypothetical protein
VWDHFNTMRTLLCLCLATGLVAGEAPQPGRDAVFLARVLADPEDGSRPWKTFRAPAESASAMVEVVGELTREELRQVAFQEFLVWFQQDLQRFWHHRGAAGPATNWAAATLPVNRYGGNPVPQNVPLGRVGF